MEIKELPFVTILMPVYNGEKYISKAIESILGQTYTNFEFVIINDGSTDKSEDLIKSFSDSRIRLINNNSNLKLIATLNKGIQLSNGKYIVRMDADDISLSNRIEVLVNFMEDNPEVGICGSYCSVIGSTVDVVKYPLTHDDLKVSLSFYNPIAHPTTIWRTQLIKEHKLSFNASYIHAEDYKFWVDCSCFFKLANIPEVLLQYRVHQLQVSIVNSAIQEKTAQQIRRDLLVKVDPDFSDTNAKVWENEVLNSNGSRNPEKIVDVIKKVIKGNTKTKFFDQQLLERKLARLWKNSIIELPAMSIKEYFHFINSPLTRIYAWTLKQKIIVLLKILK